MTDPLAAKVLTVSDGVVAGTRQDRGGPALQECLERSGFSVVERRIVAESGEAVTDGFLERELVPQANMQDAASMEAGR